MQELQNSNTPSENSEDVAADLPISPQDSNASCESSDSEHIMIAAGGYYMTRQLFRSNFLLGLPKSYTAINFLHDR